MIFPCSATRAFPLKTPFALAACIRESILFAVISCAVKWITENVKTIMVDIVPLMAIK
jgi:hypothetical protein